MYYKEIEISRKLPTIERADERKKEKKKIGVPEFESVPGRNVLSKR